MKVILCADVEKLGRLGDLVEVKPGYGRNYLLPQGFAMLATPANLKVFELERKKLEAKTSALRSEAAEIASKISNTKIVIPMRVGENDKLYGAVTTSMIMDALVEQGISVDRRKILLDTPIRLLGEYNVRVRLHADVIADLLVHVVSERSVYEEGQSAELTESETNANISHDSESEQ